MISEVRERLTFHSAPDKGEFWARNMCVRGNMGCHFSDYTDQLSMLRNGLPLAGLVTATYPIEQYEEAYQRYMGGLEGKVVLTH
jgi:threonine dehydrogenase-like Zn-dependent dehydrogenase